MKNVILLTFMSFLCLATTYAEHDYRGGSDRYDYERGYNEDFSYQNNIDYITYHGGNDFQQVTLTDVEEVWATETRQVRTTCVRKVPVTRRVCRNVGSRPHGHRHYGRHRPPTRRDCRTETSYRNESYTCYKPQSVRTRRPDRRFHANLEVVFKDLSTGGGYNRSAANFLIRLDKDRVSMDLQSQDQRGRSIFLMKEKLSTQNFGTVTEINGKLKVLVFNKREFLSPVKRHIDIRSEVHHGELVMKTGKIVFERGLSINLLLEDNYGRRPLFNGIVPKQYISIREGRYGDDSTVIVDLERLLNGRLRRGDDANVTVTLSLNKRNFEVLNKRRVPILEQTARSNVFIR